MEGVNGSVNTSYDEKEFTLNIDSAYGLMTIKLNKDQASTLYQNLASFIIQ